MRVHTTTSFEITEAEARRIFDGVLELLTEGKYVKGAQVYEASEPNYHNGDTTDVRLGSVGLAKFEVPLAAIALRDLLRRQPKKEERR